MDILPRFVSNYNAPNIELSTLSPRSPIGSLNYGLQSRKDCRDTKWVGTREQIQNSL